MKLLETITHEDLLNGAYFKVNNGLKRNEQNFKGLLISFNSVYKKFVISYQGKISNLKIHNFYASSCYVDAMATLLTACEESELISVTKLQRKISISPKTIEEQLDLFN